MLNIESLPTVYEGTSLEEAGKAVRASLKKASAKRPVSSGYPDFKSKEQVKRYYIDNYMVATTAVQKLKDLGLSEEEATDTVRDWQYERK